MQYYKNFNGPEGEVKELNSAFPSIEMMFKMSYRTLCIMCDGTFITKKATGSYNQPFYKSILNEMGERTSILIYTAVFAPGINFLFCCMMYHIVVKAYSLLIND